MNTLPLDSNGKINRSALENHKFTSNSSKHYRLKDLSSTEQSIWKIWKEVLGLKPSSLDEDFFEAGGHSLLATNMIFKIQTAFSLNLPFCDFQPISSPRKLAQWIGDRKRIEESGKYKEPLIIKPVKMKSTSKLGLKWRTFCIPDIADPDNVKSLTICRAVLLEGALKTGLLHKAMEHVINNNERLRTHAIEKNGQYFEKVEARVQLDLPKLDLTKYSEKEALRRANSLFEKECVKNVNMRNCPLVKMKLLKLTKQKHLLSLVIQHAVADGHAIEMFYKQTSQAYNDLVAKRPVSLKPSKLSYRQFEMSLEKWLAKGHEKRIKSFWKKQLRNIKPIPYPFLVKKVPEIIEWNIFDHYEFLPEWAERINGFNQTHNITTFIFFTTLIKMMVARYTSVMDSYTTSALNCRTGRQQDDIFGDFSSTILIRNRLTKTKPFLDQTKNDRSTLYNCLDHKYISVNGIDSPHKKQAAHAHTPFGQLQIIHGPDTGESLQLHGIKSRFLPRRKLGAIARLGFVLRESNGRIQITFSYAPTIFVPNSIERLKHNFQQFVRLILDNPNITLNQLPDLSTPSAYRNPVSAAEKKHAILIPL